MAITLLVVQKLDDHIPGIDRVLVRWSVVDFTLDRYDDFFSVTYCSILNGRNFTSNDFTYIGPNGSSVVDTSSILGDFLAGRIGDHAQF